jgi:hypothetical protein
MVSGTLSKSGVMVGTCQFINFNFWLTNSYKNHIIITTSRVRL